MFSDGKIKYDTKKEDLKSEIEGANENKQEETPKEDTSPSKEAAKEAGGSSMILPIVAVLGAIGAGIAIFGSGESKPEDSKPSDNAVKTEEA